MSRTLGSKNKSSLEKAGIEIALLHKEAMVDAVKIMSTPKPVHYDLTLSIRAFRDGRFKGLWELSKLKSDGKREIVVDATSRQSVINMVNRQIMKMVIA